MWQFDPTIPTWGSLHPADVLHLLAACCCCRRDSKGNNKDSLSPPWFYKESPEFYGW